MGSMARDTGTKPPGASARKAIRRIVGGERADWVTSLVTEYGIDRRECEGRTGKRGMQDRSNGKKWCNMYVNRCHAMLLLSEIYACTVLMMQSTVYNVSIWFQFFLIVCYVSNKNLFD